MSRRYVKETIAARWGAGQPVSIAWKVDTVAAMLAVHDALGAVGRTVSYDLHHTQITKGHAAYVISRLIGIDGLTVKVSEH